MIFDKLLISVDLLNSMKKSLFVVCIRNFESQYLSSVGHDYPITLTKGPFDSSVWYGLEFHQNGLQYIQLYQF